MEDKTEIIKITFRGSWLGQIPEERERLASEKKVILSPCSLVASQNNKHQQQRVPTEGALQGGACCCSSHIPPYWEYKTRLEEKLGPQNIALGGRHGCGWPKLYLLLYVEHHQNAISQDLETAKFMYLEFTVKSIYLSGLR